MASRDKARGSLESRDGLRLQQPGLQQRRAESHQVRRGGEKSPSARQAGVVRRRRLLDAEPGPQDRSRRAGGRVVQALSFRDDGAVHAEPLEYLALRLAMPDRPWIAMVAAAAVMALVLWILAELAALCRSVRDGQPFAPHNAGRIRRLAMALVLAEVSRAAIVYTAHAYVAAHFAADHLRFTASPHINAQAIVSALILLVLTEVFRTGTRLDEDQSLTV